MNSESEPMQARIVVLAGDGIGPEVTDEAKKILNVVAGKFGHSFEFDHQLMGGCAIDLKGTSLPEETVQACVGHLQERFGATVESRTVREEKVSFPLPRELRLISAG